MFYGPVVESVRGCDDECTATTIQQALVHGIKGRDGNKVRHSGLKHNALNKTEMTRQKEILDKSPYFIFIPILSENDIRMWRTKKGSNRSYEALVLVGLEDDSTDYRDEVYVRTPCTLDEVKLAIDMFDKYTKALSRLVQQTDFSYLQNMAPSKFNKEVKKKLTQFNDTKS